MSVSALIKYRGQKCPRLRRKTLQVDVLIRVMFLQLLISCLISHLQLAGLGQRISERFFADNESGLAESAGGSQTRNASLQALEESGGGVDPPPLGPIACSHEVLPTRLVPLQHPTASVCHVAALHVLSPQQCCPILPGLQQCGRHSPGEAGAWLRRDAASQQQSGTSQGLRLQQMCVGNWGLRMVRQSL
ncbi:hypothetical protein NDU88_002049 [Pleurodeles waltl]|uniref:Uncharacterized protein n=1 Tax=Pleurodeles waltl TaxID=8319 RepID=A0AAV7KT35_PLEWA|nr:hypothetical protein NDU88_002049 [Pleurodeles waltl]